MRVVIEKELCDPKPGKDGYAEICGPFYYVYSVDEETGKRELLQIFDNNIQDAARFAERQVDFNALEVALKEDPHAFESVTHFPSIISFNVEGVPVEKQMEILELLTPIVEKLKETK